MDYILFFRMLAEIAWNENNGYGRWGDADAASVMGDLREAFYDTTLHDRLVAALTVNDKDSSNSNCNSNSNSNKETNRVMEIGDEPDEGQEPGLGLGQGSDSSSILSLSIAWKDWLVNYRTRLVADNRPRTDRIKEQQQANPKYVLRNWMAVLASEQVITLFALL